MHFPFPSSRQEPRSPASPWAGRDVSGNPGARASYLSHSPTLPCIPHPHLNQLSTCPTASRKLKAARPCCLPLPCPIWALSPCLQGCRGDGCVRRLRAEGIPPDRQLQPCLPGAFPTILRMFHRPGQPMPQAP